MKLKILTRYGLYSTAVLLVLNLISLVIFGLSSENYDSGAVFGYTSIALSLVFVFFGIRHYRDEHLNGSINFWQSLKTGLLIAAFPALAFGLYNILYSEVIDPDFMDKYYEHELGKIELTMSTPEFEVAKAEMESQKNLFMNPVFQFLIMFLTVWIMGLVVSIVSSLSLVKNKNTQKNVK